MKENRAVFQKALISILLILVLTTLVNARTAEFYTVNINKSVDSLRIYRMDDIDYIDLNVLSSILSLDSYYKKTQETIRIESDDSYVIITMNSPYFRKAGKIFKMPYSPVYMKDIILVPIHALMYIFKDMLPSNSIFNAYELSISRNAKIRDIIEHNEYIDIVFDMIPSYDMEKSLRDLIFFIKDCSTAEDFSAKKNTGLLRVLKTIMNDSELTLIVTYNPAMEFDYIKDIGDTLRLMFKKRKTAPSNNNTITIQTVIIDAGHGGKDPGAIGPTGLKEKTVTLDIAMRLKDLIQSKLKNVKVIMTRSDDRYVSLQERTLLANKYPDAVFISIHCNASYNKNAKGAETYFLSTAKTDWQRAVEARENASLAFDVKIEDREGIDFVLWDLAQNEFLSESSHLAELIQMHFESNTKNPRGLNQAGFYVLKGNYMPAVLVETAFISNKEEETLLKTSSFRQTLAENIFNGIKVYIDDYSKKNK